MSASISLYFCQDGSDKEYHAEIKGDDAAGYTVNFRYGRRGSALQSGTKTNSPVSLDKAMGIYEKLVKEKKSKGYTEGESGTPFTGSEKAGEVSGILPQLLNPISEAELSTLLVNPFFVLQEKKDGERRMVKKMGSTVEGINRKGLIVPLPEAIVSSMLGVKGDFVVDGELIGNEIFLFDMLEYDGLDLRSKGYGERSFRLLDIFDSLSPSVIVVETFSTTASFGENAALAYRKFREQGVEGVVLKDLRAPYSVGRPNSGGSQLKFKFYETCSAIVSEGRDGKRSVGLVMLDHQGSEVFVGNVTIPPNFSVPDVGQICEIRYLYAYDGGSLYQPTYLGARNDLDRADCVTSQLKYKLAA